MQIIGELYAQLLNVWGEDPFYLMFWTQDKAENLCPCWESKSGHLSFGLATTETELTLFGDREGEKNV
jgi:hypothetical protein